MEVHSFISYYEVLGLPPNASASAIDRKFRHLARLFHPDNQETGDRIKFDAVVEAHNTLKDRVRRTQYHEDNKERLPPFWDLGGDDGVAADGDGAAGVGEEERPFEGVGIDRDVAIQNNLLILLYFRRRRNVKEPGMGDVELEHLSGCPPEHLDFHIWYLKQKGWIAMGEDGLLAITIDGVDRAAQLYRETANKLITDQT
jgi:curved DNA-binding protein CbpA